VPPEEQAILKPGQLQEAIISLTSLGIQEVEQVVGPPLEEDELDEELEEELDELDELLDDEELEEEEDDDELDEPDELDELDELVEPEELEEELLEEEEVEGGSLHSPRVSLHPKSLQP